MFLSDDEIEDLTGYRQPARQARAAIRDAQDELARLRAIASTPEDADVYLTLRRGLKEDIAANEELIALYRADLERLPQFRRDR